MESKLNINNDNFKYGFWVNQKAVYDWLKLKNRKLDLLNEFYVLCYIINVWHNTNGLKTEMKDGIKYVYLNNKLIISNLVFLNIKSRQMSNYIKKFENIGLIRRYTKDQNSRYITVNSELASKYFIGI